MPEGRPYKPGDTYKLDGTEFIVGKDYEWHVNTSLLGQAAQGLMIDAPMGVLGLGKMVVNAMDPYGKEPRISDAAMQGPQRMYEGLARAAGVNVAQPQTMEQRFARAGGQIPAQTAVGMASGGESIGAELAGATGGAVAAQAAQEAGGGGVAQFGAGLAGDLLSRRPPMKTVKLAGDLISDVRNVRNIRAMKLIQPLDLANEGASKVMREVDAQHIARKATMEGAYAKLGKSQKTIGADRLAAAADAMLEEAGDASSPRLAHNLYVQVRDLLAKGKGEVSYDRLRALMKDANALLDTRDPARTGLAQQQGQIRGILIPAISQTFDDFVAEGERQLRTMHPNRGAVAAKREVELMRAANEEAKKYYELFDKRSKITKELVDGIAGGQTLDPKKALRKVLDDPKMAVENAQAIMQIIGVNPRNTSIMRRAFVESVVPTDLANFSAKASLTQLEKMKPAAIEILGQNGYEHFHNLLVKLKNERVANAGRTRNIGRGAGGFIGYFTGTASPFMGGMIGAALGDVSVVTAQYLKSHFGQEAARHLAVEAIYDPSVAALLHANPRRIGSAELERSLRTALVRSGYRFSTSGPVTPRLPMLPSEQRTDPLQPIP